MGESFSLGCRGSGFSGAVTSAPRDLPLKRCYSKFWGAENERREIGGRRKLCDLNMTEWQMAGKVSGSGKWRNEKRQTVLRSKNACNSTYCTMRQLGVFF